MKPSDLFTVNLSQTLSIIKDASIVTGGLIALLNYLGQNRQKKIDNAFTVVKIFRDSFLEIQ
ncbi:hypothetical protein [Vacuolonema iberomarrocanum]|uniref:hypothetical protein n=1 Tax=Vacuolonema iberomarrocanum TaxID=3454632 RepID=UPI0019E6CA40|nr:hypothetical protein [filamentous cyanobacterium LEGE 07170]